MSELNRMALDQLRLIEDGWTDVGPASGISRTALKRLLEMELIVVRTVSFSYWGFRGWVSDPVEKGQRVQAKLTEQGVDMKAAHSE